MVFIELRAKNSCESIPTTFRGLTMFSFTVSQENLDKITLGKDNSMNVK